ncbi:MAG TPA: flagellar hook-associated protein FlgL, partial [Rhodoferax sp.]|nr:flagellar hook-associated protein FlgL [Rhodoferax sp.]
MAGTSFSRLSTANSYDNALRNLQTRQTALANLQENLTSGKRVVVASDDPTGAAQAERSLTRMSRIAADQRALEAQRNSITQAEGTLGDITDALQNFRELMVSAGNGSHTPAERKTIALQLTGLREQILSYSNRKDTNGLPLFGALASGPVPIQGPQSTDPDYSFDGLPGQRVSNEVAIPFTLDGDSAFMHQTARDGVYNVTLSTIPTGRTLQTSNVVVNNNALVNGASYSIAITGVDTTTVPGTTTVTYSVTENPSVSGPIAPQTASYPSAQPGTIAVTAMPGLTLSMTGTPAAGDTITVDPSPSIFSVMDDAIRDLGGAANANAATQAVSQALHNIDIGMERISAVRGQAGDLLNRADRITDNQSKRSVQLEADRSRAEDLDMIKGVADFQNQQTGYQAALQSYAQVQKLSLFN